MGRLDGKVAIVTGGSRGIGAGACLSLALEGAVIAVNYERDLAEAVGVVEEVRRLGARAEAFQADISDKRQVAEMMEQVALAFGGIDILVNNAGICKFTPFFEIDEETWNRTFAVNVTGAFFCSQIAAKYMIERGGGSIIHISTVTAFRVNHDQIHYGASKGGLNSLSAGLAAYLGQYGIRSNAILCGGVPTAINQSQRDQYQMEQASKAYHGSLPMRRIGDPEDLGKAVVFLAAGDSEWITGAMIAVDGGFMVM